MEREPKQERIKLTVVASVDYPEATEILVSFPDQWELIHYMTRDDTPLYLAALPPQQERPRPDHFYGLPAEINRTLTTYQMYQLFEPWSMPHLTVNWDVATGTGHVAGMHDLKLQLQPIGQAQIWKGPEYGVVWEGYLFETRRKGNWQDELAELWHGVERDLSVTKVFTEPREPTFEEGYTDFLSRLGYAPDPNYPRWWSKSVRE